MYRRAFPKNAYKSLWCSHAKTRVNLTPSSWFYRLCTYERIEDVRCELDMQGYKAHSLHALILNSTSVSTIISSMSNEICLYTSYWLGVKLGLKEHQLLPM